MRNCDFPPEEFVDRLRAAHRHVFLIDEPRAVLSEVAWDGIRKLARGRGRFNL